jgi:hypothetical protein
VSVGKIYVVKEIDIHCLMGIKYVMGEDDGCSQQAIDS